MKESDHRRDSYKALETLNRNASTALESFEKRVLDIEEMVKDIRSLLLAQVNNNKIFLCLLFLILCRGQCRASKPLIQPKRPRGRNGWDKCPPIRDHSKITILLIWPFLLRQCNSRHRQLQLNKLLQNRSNNLLQLQRQQPLQRRRKWRRLRQSLSQVCSKLHI